MIRISVTRKNKDYISFESSGHAGYADEGNDIVCAGVSALVITTVNALETFTKDSVKTEEDDGFVRLTFSGPNSPEARLLMDTLLLGLAGIKESLDDGSSRRSRYMKVTIREVKNYDENESSAVRP